MIEWLRSECSQSSLLRQAAGWKAQPGVCIGWFQSVLEPVWRYRVPSFRNPSAGFRKGCGGLNPRQQPAGTTIWRTAGWFLIGPVGSFQTLNINQLPDGDYSFIGGRSDQERETQGGDWWNPRCWLWICSGLLWRSRGI